MKRSGLKRRSVGQQHGSVGNGISCQAWQPVSPSELRAYKKRTNSSKLSSDLQKDDRACMPTYSTTSTNTNNIHMHKIKHTHWGRINKLTNNQMNIKQSQDGWCLRKDFWSAYSCVWGQAQTYTHTHTQIFLESEAHQLTPTFGHGFILTTVHGHVIFAPGLTELMFYVG